MNNNYDDIINLEHYTSKKHKRMSLENRCAQFNPFSALSGYEDAVLETARLTDNKIEIDEELKQILNNKLNMLKEFIKDSPLVIITYFVKDNKKEGGRYVVVEGFLDKIKEIEGYVLLKDKTKIYIKDIIDIDSECVRYND